MKIAVVDVYNPFPINSGGDWYRYQILRDLAEGHDVTEYYLVEKKSGQGYMPREYGFKVEYLRSAFPWSKFSTMVQMARPDLYLNFSYLDDIEADLIIYSVYCYPLAKRISRANNDARMILFMHNVEWQYLKNTGSALHSLFRLFEDRVIAQSEGIITLSEHDCRYAKALNQEGKVYYLPPLVNEAVFSPQGKKHSFGRDKINVLFYGSLDRKHNIDAIEYIIDEILPEMEKRANFRLIIFGSGRPPAKLLENQDRVDFIGPVEDPGEVIRGVDVTIVPVKNGAGTKIRVLESLACQVPSIVSPETAQGLPGDLRDYVTVAGTAKEYVDRMDSIVSNGLRTVSSDRLREIIGDNTAEKIVDDFRSTTGPWVDPRGYGARPSAFVRSR